VLRPSPRGAVCRRWNGLPAAASSAPVPSRRRREVPQEVPCGDVQRSGKRHRDQVQISDRVARNRPWVGSGFLFWPLD
jgi:hypothetical protein